MNAGKRYTKKMRRASWESVLAQMGLHGFVVPDARGKWTINGERPVNELTVRSMVRIGLLVEDRWGALRRGPEA